MIHLLTVLGIALLPVLSQAQSEKPNKQDSFTLGTYYYAWYNGPGVQKDLGWMKSALRGRLRPQQLPNSVFMTAAMPMSSRATSNSASMPGSISGR